MAHFRERIACSLSGLGNLGVSIEKLYCLNGLIPPNHHLLTLLIICMCLLSYLEFPCYENFRAVETLLNEIGMPSDLGIIF
jgi:hypothetical protein